MNHFALKQTNQGNADFKKLYSTLSEEDWGGMCELEAITNDICLFAVSDAQSSNTNNVSLKPFYRKCLKQTLAMDAFEIMSIEQQPSMQRLQDWPRAQKKVEDMTEFGKKYLSRIQKTDGPSYDATHT